MKVPIKWIKDYVNIEISPKELGERLTLSGSKLEEIITSGEEITNVVTGRIEKIEPHPDAEKLVICQLNVGQEELVQIVTGADNMKEQDIVPVALHGSSLPGGLKIKKGKLRGVVSNGMMCSLEELGIADEKPVEGLMILPPTTPIGKDIVEVLGLESTVLDFEITSNRPDCMSILGMARETAATLDIPLNKPELTYSTACSENIEDTLKVEIKSPLCRRYMARGVKNVRIAPSPSWMQERLLQAGVRPINNIVDITNFVMLELGEPMHAFDRRQITTKHIVIEGAAEGDKFVTLDGIERTLTSDSLLIKDGDKGIALAGIMGGLNSEIKEDTKELIFECANFDGTNVRETSRRLNLRTESSSRFEKDIDPNLASLALDRACHLIEQLNCGEVMEGTVDVYPNPVQSKTLRVSSSWINKFLGTDISAEKMVHYLQGLEFHAELQGEELVVNSPTFRIDIAIKEDIAEEVARIYGYNNIPTTMVKGSGIKGGKSKKQKQEDKIVQLLLGAGLNEAICYSFISSKYFDKIALPADSVLRRAVTIKNPLGEDYSIMRTTALPSIMEALSINYARSNDKCRLFEIGKVYLPKENSNELPKEKNVITIGMYGKVEYVDIKGIVEVLLEGLGIEAYSFARECENPSYHPGKTAKILYKGEILGVLGEVSPVVCENYGIEQCCYAAELDMDAMLAHGKSERKYTPLPKFPAVTRDIALLVEDTVLVQEIEEIIRKQGGALLENYSLFDVYKGKQIPEGKKSVAYALAYRSLERTLKDEEVNKVHNKIVRALEYTLGAQLR